MPTEKKGFISDVDKKNLALVTVGGGVGCTVPLALKLYADPSYPDGLPYVKDFVPWPWSSPSTFIGLIGGAVALIGGIFIKPVRYFLLPFGVTSLATSTMLALITPESPAGRLRGAPAGRTPAVAGKLRSAQTVTLRAAGSPGTSFAQKSPEQRLQQLKKESSDIELQSQIEKLEEENRFKKSQPSSAIPLRT